MQRTFRPNFTVVTVVALAALALAAPRASPSRNWRR